MKSEACSPRTGCRLLSRTDTSMRTSCTPALKEGRWPCAVIAALAMTRAARHGHGQMRIGVSVLQPDLSGRDGSAGVAEYTPPSGLGLDSLWARTAVAKVPAS